MDELAIRVAEAVRARRRELRLSQPELADLAGVSERAIRDLEHCTTSPRLGTLAGVLDALGLAMRIELRAPGQA